MPSVGIAFRLHGRTIPADHGYRLFSAVQQILPEVHGDTEIGIHPISGQLVGNRQLQLTDRSHLTVRVSADRVRHVLPLAGKTLRIGRNSIRVGVPHTRALIPAPALRSRLVVIKGFMEPDAFLGAVNRQLEQLNIRGKPALARRAERLSVEGTRAAFDNHAYVRRTIRIRDKEIVGFALMVTELTAEESLRLQEVGLGGRRRFGCGVFVPQSIGRR